VLVTAIVATIVYLALLLFIVLMWARFIIDLVTSLSRSWRPRGTLLVIVEFAYLITDPPIKVVRRVVPPIRFGGIAIDLAWSIVLLVAIILSSIAGRFL
jgi:YggT family protein